MRLSQVFKKGEDPADFCFINPDPSHRLSHFERLTLTGGEELEKALSWIARQFVSFSLEREIGTLSKVAFDEAHRFYASPELIAEPRTFFTPPNASPLVRETVIHGLKGGEIVDLEFRSGYRAQFPGYAEEYASIKANQSVHARLWRHEKKGAPTLIAIHGWTMGDQRINSLAFLPGLLFKKGYNVALFELPFHGRRATDKASAGKLFPSTDLKRTNEAMGQSISDLRLLRRYINECGSERVGWIGVSLGAYVGALWSSLDPLDVAIPIVPLVSMAEIAWAVITRHPVLKGLLQEGLTAQLVDEVYRFHSPLAYVPATNPAKALIIGGLGDKMVPVRQVKALMHHWHEARAKWFRGGHAAALIKTAAFKEIFKFLKRELRG